MKNGQHDHACEAKALAGIVRTAPRKQHPARARNRIQLILYTRSDEPPVFLPSGCSTSNSSSCAVLLPATIVSTGSAMRPNLPKMPTRSGAALRPSLADQCQQSQGSNTNTTAIKIRCCTSRQRLARSRPLDIGGERVKHVLGESSTSWESALLGTHCIIRIAQLQPRTDPAMDAPAIRSALGRTPLARPQLRTMAAVSRAGTQASVAEDLRLCAVCTQTRASK